MDDEIQAVEKNETLELTYLPGNRELVVVKWVGL